MTDWGDSERVAAALHALTGEWLAGDAIRILTAAAGSRDEFLATGIIDRGWLGASSPALAAFSALAASALSADPAGEDRSVPAPAPSAGLSRAAAMKLVEHHREEPGAVHPFEALARLAEKAEADYPPPEDFGR